jgi:hypothetical protein
MLGPGALATSLALVPGALAMAPSMAMADPSSRAGDQHLDRMVIWRGLDAWRSEVVAMRLDPKGIEAKGSQGAVDPLPYRLDYHLQAPDDFVTRRIVLETQGAGWWRRLDLRRDGNGKWTAKTSKRGKKVKLPDPGGDMGSVKGALDCDLGLSPLTNLMPIRRSGLNRHPGAEDFLMAWISVPDLHVLASGQRYEHVRNDKEGSVVRYVDRGLFPGYKANLRLDRSGIVTVYPGLGKRVNYKPRS